MQRIVCEQTGLRSAVREEKGGYMRETVSDIQNRRRYLTELIIDLGYKAMAVSSADIPHFGEIFGLF